MLTVVVEVDSFWDLGLGCEESKHFICVNIFAALREIEGFMVLSLEERLFRHLNGKF